MLLAHYRPIDKEKADIGAGNGRYFRVAITTLRSLDASNGVSFRTSSLPGDRCVRLLVTKVGRLMTEGLVHGKLDTVGFCVQVVMQLRSGRLDQNPEKNRQLTLHLIVSVT